MALNIKNVEVERLAVEAAELGHESKTEAILERFRTEFPRGDFGRETTKAEEDKILGFGPDGV